MNRFILCVSLRKCVCVCVSGWVGISETGYNFLPSIIPLMEQELLKHTSWFKFICTVWYSEQNVPTGGNREGKSEGERDFRSNWVQKLDCSEGNIVSMLDLKRIKENQICRINPYILALPHLFAIFPKIEKKKTQFLNRNLENHHQSSTQKLNVELIKFEFKQCVLWVILRELTRN